jgi:hypothetical protein
MAKAPNYDLDGYPKSVTQVNRLLASKGIAERVAQAAGDVFFTDGQSHRWYSSSLSVYRVSHLSFRKYLDAHESMSNDPRNSTGSSDLDGQ